VSPDLSLARFEARLAAHRPARPTLVAGRRAAVAALLRFGPGGPEVLLMKRAERDDDRWSGHVSLPGGRAEADDADLLSTALRETREELGLDLGRAARLLGELDAVRAVARGKILPMTITPFVFCQIEDHPVVPGAEAESWFWLPLGRAAAGALDGTHELRLGPVPVKLPCWRHEGYLVWGLTYQMLRGLLDLVR